MVRLKVRNQATLSLQVTQVRLGGAAKEGTALATPNIFLHLAYIYGLIGAATRRWRQLLDI